MKLPFTHRGGSETINKSKTCDRAPVLALVSSLSRSSQGPAPLQGSRAGNGGGGQALGCQDWPECAAARGTSA